MQINKTDQNDAEGLAQIMRTGWYRPVHVKSLEAHRARAILGARSQLMGMTTRLSNHTRGVLKTFGLLPGAVRGLPFDRRIEVLLGNRPDLALIVRPMLTAWVGAFSIVRRDDFLISAWGPAPGEPAQLTPKRSRCCPRTFRWFTGFPAHRSELDHPDTSRAADFQAG
jgi:hypothetical protein